MAGPAARIDPTGGRTPARKGQQKNPLHLYKNSRTQELKNSRTQELKNSKVNSSALPRPRQTAWVRSSASYLEKRSGEGWLIGEPHLPAGKVSTCKIFDFHVTRLGQRLFPLMSLAVAPGLTRWMVSRNRSAMTRPGTLWNSLMAKAH